MLDRILLAIDAFIRRHELPRPAERVVCAVSGGADSVALLAAMCGLAKELDIEVVAAHVNHGLRGADADRDARFVEALAARLGVPFHLASVPPTRSRRGSPEAWARELRREGLLRIASERAGSRILLGHSLDDQAETVLFRALTGTSLSGLSAMAPVSPDGLWLRPLLGLSRAEIRRSLRRAGLEWVEDRTNTDGRLPRGRVRHEILPLIEARLGPGSIAALSRLAEEAADADRELAARGDALLEEMLCESSDSDGLQLDVSALGRTSAVVRRYALRSAFETVRGGRQDLTRAHLLALDRLAGRTGALDLPGVHARSEHGRLTLRTGGPRSGAADLQPARLPCPGSLELAGLGLRFETRLLDAGPTPPGLLQPGADRAGGERIAWFDADRVRPPLIVRGRRPGDRMVPFGGSGRRKIKRLMAERRVARSDRAQVPILTDRAGILWVVGLRRSERAPIGPETRRVLAIRVNKVPACEVNEGGQDVEP